jgi:hypothetical protein
VLFLGPETTSFGKNNKEILKNSWFFWLCGEKNCYFPQKSAELSGQLPFFTLHLSGL